MKLRAAVAAIGLLLALTNPAAAHAVGFSVDPNPVAVAALRPCVLVEDLDCIQSVSVFDADSKLSGLNLLGVRQGRIYTDQNGNSVDSTNVDYQGINVKVELETPNHRITPTLNGGALRLFATPQAGNEKNRYQFEIRTSWLKPQDIQLKAFNTDYSMKKIPGGTLWTLIGAQGMTSGYSEQNYKENYLGPADWTFPSFAFFIHHSDPRGSYFGTRCDDKGFTVESHVAPGAGQPFWNPGSQSLEFNIRAAHLTKTGEENIGFFRYWVNDDYLNCQFPGNTLAKSANVTVSVTDENGEAQTAISFVSHKNGQLIVWVEGFHFSSPTIQIKSATVSPKPVIKKTITCVKGKTTKKVTAVAPKCPAGFKKK